MAVPNFLPFSSLVNGAVAAIQGKATALIDLAVGSVTLAVVEAAGSVAMWLQYVALVILASTRLSTSTGGDVDTWIGDFGLTRLPAGAASGPETFGRYTSNTGITVPVGATVRKGDATSDYTLVADTTNAAFSQALFAGLGGYTLPAGAAELTATVVCTVPGSGGNAIAGGVTLIGTSIAGLDYVTNATAFTNGFDAETDAAFKSRFALFIGSLSRGTLVAVEAAVDGVQQGLTFFVDVNRDEAARWRPGFFTVIVDDGSGHPPSALLSAVYTAVNGIKECCELFAVLPPTVVPATVSMALTVGPGATKAVVVTKVIAALSAYVDSLPISAVLPFSKLAALAYAVDPVNVTNVSSVTLNGSTADLTPGNRGVVKLSAAPTVN